MKLRIRLYQFVFCNNCEQSWPHRDPIKGNERCMTTGCEDAVQRGGAHLVWSMNAENEEALLSIDKLYRSRAT